MRAPTNLAPHDRSAVGASGLDPEKFRRPFGNHEFYVGVKASVTFMEKAGIKVLRDDLTTIPGVVNIIGIDDPTGKRRYRGFKEKTAYRDIQREG